MTLYRLLAKVRPIELGQLIRSVLPIGRREVIVEDRRMWIDPLSQFGGTLLANRSYEPDATSTVASILEPGDVFIDVGANEGWFSILASFLVGANGRVVSAEPQARCWPVILRNLVINRRLNCQLLPFGFGAREAWASIALYPSLNAEASTMVPGLRWSLFPRQDTYTTTVDVLLGQMHVYEMKLMKIDCEGYEFEVLKGAETTLRKKAVKYLLIEYHPKQLNALGQSVAEMETYLSGMDYQRIACPGVNLFQAS